MPMISSLANPHVKRIRRLQKDKRFRTHEQAFVVEGTRMIQELSADPDRLETLYYTQDWLANPGHNAILKEAELSGGLVTYEVMAAMSATETPPGVLASTSMNPLPLPSQPTLVLIVDAVTTPGNLGTMLRSAGAAAVDAVLLAPGCVDAYNPKVVRGAMGAHFRVPVRHLSWHKIVDYCESVVIWLSEANGENNYAEMEWRRPCALIVSNEARGAGTEALLAANGTVYIPMAKATESLNAATAAAVILFEAFRQRDFAKSEKKEERY